MSFIEKKYITTNTKNAQETKAVIYVHHHRLNWSLSALKTEHEHKNLPIEKTIFTISLKIIHHFIPNQIYITTSNGAA